MNHSVKKSISSMTSSWQTTGPTKRIFASIAILLSCALFIHTMKSWGTDSNDANEQLLRQFIQSKGAGIISFDSSNIKQFWIDRSIMSKQDLFVVQLSQINLEKNESIPLKIQLANVNEAQDCKVEVIADDKDFIFSVLNNKLKVISKSSPEENFLHYNVVSSVIHLEDTTNLSFCIKFESGTKKELSIKGIILSFSKNDKSSFMASPGTIQMQGRDLFTDAKTKDFNDQEHSFTVSGKRFGVISLKKILVADNVLSNSVKIKNTGDKPTRVYFGYAPYTKDGKQIHNRNNPYNGINHVLTVVSSEINSNRIVVDSYPEWKKGCCLVLNAKEDLSDFPNFSFVEGAISEIKKIDDAHTEIIFDKAIKTEIKPETKVRVQSPHGDTYIYTNSKMLNPGDEAVFSSTIVKDESLMKYTNKAFSKGTYYVCPVILSYSVDPQEENTIIVSDFTVSY